MYCSTCGAQIDTAARLCPTCVADLTQSGAIRLTAPMTETEIRRELPEELVETAIRPPISFEASSPATPRAPHTPTDPHHDVPLDPRSFDEPEQARRAEAAQRRVLAARSRQHTRRNQIAVVVLTLALLVAVVPIVIVSWSFFNLSPDASASPSATPTAAASSAAPSSQAPSASQPATTGAARPTPPVVRVTRLPWPSYARACGNDVAANRQTSCEFARVVLGKVDRKRTGTFTVTATSPITNRSYTLNCSRPDFIVCTGGNSVRILLQPL